MDLELLVSYSPNIFYQIQPNTYLYVLAGDRNLAKGKYSVVPYFATSSLDLPLTIFEVRSLSGLVGYLFKPTLPCTYYSTGLLVYKESWRSNKKDLKFDPSTFGLAFKCPHFFVHSALNKCYLVSSPKLSTSTENVLTAV